MVKTSTQTRSGPEARDHVTRGGRDKDRDASPERRCIASGDVLPKAALVRFVIGPEGEVVPDVAGRLPGRGIWVKAEAAALERAIKRNLFSRAARQPVKVPEGLAALTVRLVLERLSAHMALARKAGLALAGFEKVRGALDGGGVVALFQAADGSPRQRSKLRLDPEEGPSFTCLTARELGLSFGRENVIHAALTAGGLSARVIEEAARLEGLRGATAPLGASPGSVTGGHTGVGDT